MCYVVYLSYINQQINHDSCLLAFTSTKSTISTHIFSSPFTCSKFLYQVLRGILSDLSFPVMLYERNIINGSFFCRHSWYHIII